MLPAKLLSSISVLGFLFCSSTLAQNAQVGTGIANTGDLRVEGSITIGITPEELQAAIDAAMRKSHLDQNTVDRYKLQVERLSAEINVRKDALETFLLILGENKIPLEQLNAKLAEIALRHREMLDRWLILSKEEEDPEIQDVVDKARSAIDNGDYGRADDLLSKAESLNLADAHQAQKLAEAAIEAASRGLVAAAEKRASRGELAMTRLAYLEAADHFAQAAEIVPESEPDLKTRYQEMQAEGYLMHGVEFGDNDALSQSIKFLEETRTAYANRKRLLDWARTQNALGNALQSLGEREPGTERLKEAVTAYREALKVRTREQVPLDWSATQSNLGVALGRLGKREQGTARLKEAVTAYREALKERTREETPLGWAMIQNNLGTALVSLGKLELSLGKLEQGTARLEEAVAAYREALKEHTRERDPLNWATTQNNIGTALQSLGEREPGTERLKEAVDAYQEALEELTRERAPLVWATTQSNLGTALLSLGERELGTARLKEAVAAYREALKERTRERAPLDWAATQHNLGRALASWGEKTGDRVVLQEARDSLLRAHEVYRDAGLSHHDDYFNGLVDLVETLLTETEQ